jgi:hypothetical protein
METTARCFADARAAGTGRDGQGRRDRELQGMSLEPGSAVFRVVRFVGEELAEQVE